MSEEYNSGYRNPYQTNGGSSYQQQLGARDALEAQFPKPTTSTSTLWGPAGGGVSYDPISLGGGSTGSASGGASISFAGFCIGVASAVYAHGEGLEIIPVFLVFAVSAVVGSILFGGITSLLSAKVFLAAAVAVGVIMLVIWIKEFVVNYAGHAVPYNWVAGWYYFMFRGIGFAGKMAFILVAWPWALKPFEDSNWNMGFGVILSILSVTGMYFLARYLRGLLRKWKLDKKLLISTAVLAVGPAACGVLWKLGSLAIKWLTS